MTSGFARFGKKRKKDVDVKDIYFKIFAVLLTVSLM